MPGSRLEIFISWIVAYFDLASSRIAETDEVSLAVRSIGIFASELDIMA